MKKYFLIAALILLTSCISSKKVNYLTLPPATQKDSIDIEAYAEKYKDYNGVYLEKKISLEHTGGQTELFSSWKFHRIHKVKYIVLNPDYEKLTTFKLTKPNSGKIILLYLRITQPNGQVKTYQLGDLKVEKNSYGMSVYKFVYPEVKKGCIIEEAFEMAFNAAAGTPPLKHDIELQFSIPCEKLSLEYAYPDWWHLKFKDINKDEKIDYDYIENNENKKNIIKYVATDIPAIKYEPYSPYFKEIAKYFEFMVSDMVMLGRYYNSPKTWKEVGKFYEDYTMHKDGFLSRKVKNTVKALTKDLSTKEEKLDTILNYVYKNIEISNSFRKFNFSRILDLKKANYVQITGLVQSMLLKADIPTDFLLVHSAKDGYFDKNYISHQEIYTPALRVNIDGKEFAIFPYIKNLPIEHTPDYYQGQQALVIKKGEVPEFWTIPSGNRADNSVEENYSLEIDEDGEIKVHEEKILNGFWAFSFRETFKDYNEEKKKETIKNMLTYTDGDVEISDYSLENLTVYKKPLKINIDYSIGNLVTLTPEEVIFQTGGLFSPTSFKKYKIDSDKRMNPIQIDYNESYVKNININYPDNWELQSALNDISFENEFGSISGNYMVEEGKIKIKQIRKLIKNRQPKEKITEFIQISGSKYKLSVPNIIFNVKN